VCSRNLWVIRAEFGFRVLQEETCGVKSSLSMDLNNCTRSFSIDSSRELAPSPLRGPDWNQCRMTAKVLWLVAVQQRDLLWLGLADQLWRMSCSNELQGGNVRFRSAITRRCHFGCRCRSNSSTITMPGVSRKADSAKWGSKLLRVVQIADQREHNSLPVAEVSEELSALLVHQDNQVFISSIVIKSIGTFDAPCHGTLNYAERNRVCLSGSETVASS